MSIASENSALIVELAQLSKKAPKLVKGTETEVPGCEEITVHSWKMNEFKYYDVPSPFPTLARGLFTTDVKDGGDIKHRIVIRGYDKFFNIGEVPWTTWPALKEHTGAPYVLSLKSNGCIIFIAAITPQKLIVTSKHSVGSGDDTVSHAARGRTWLNTYLTKNGRTEADMAAVLWDKQWTAIAELCDDSFEEHVLPYSPEKTGLHLHGLNVCSKTFNTLSHNDVDAFAEEWGFIRTATVTLDTIEEVQSFTEDVSKSGQWNGEPVEGFVVRTHITRAQKQTPYAPGSSFFFKVKFDEPYMMYRDWREVTKSLLAAHAKGAKMTERSLPKNKMKRKETQEYVAWVIRDIECNPHLYEAFTKNKGIVATRERFFKYLESGKSLGPAVEATESKVFGKTVIVPVAIPGCGKTSVSLALAHLFGWGHTQSDNVQAKKAAPVFIKNVVNLLHKHDVVIADKNNHLKQHRKALRTAFQYETPPVRLLALNWGVFSKPPALVHRICSDRIWKRGEKHQTLRPDLDKGKAFHEEVVWMFLNTSEELVPDEVDAVVDMDIEEEGGEEEESLDGLEKQVRRAVEGVCGVLGLEIPSDEKLQEAVEYVREYEDQIASGASGASTKKKQGKKTKEEARAGAGAKKAGGQKKEVAPRYYGLLPEVNLVKMMETALSSSDADGKILEDLKSFWTQLKEDKRIIKRPHVTIVHKNELRGGGELGGEQAMTKDLWERCEAIRELEGAPLFEGSMGSIVWNRRVMAVTVDDLHVHGDSENQEEDLPESLQQCSVTSHTGPSNTAYKAARGVMEKIGERRRGRLHITVGTRDGSVPPVEGKGLVEAFRGLSGSCGEKIWSVPLGGVVVKGLLKGLQS